MSFMQLEKLKLYYEIYGEGEPFILINGLKADHTGWMPVLEELKQHFQVILLDNRAVGQTTDDGQSFSLEDMAKDVIALLNHLHIDAAYIAGHSMGGTIAQIIAHQYPDRVKKVFLCNTFVKFADKPSQAFTDILALQRKGITPGDVMRAIIPWGFTQSFATLDFITKACQAFDENPFPQSSQDYERQLNALKAFNSLAWAKDIHVPTVVIGSEEDVTAFPEQSQELAQLIDADLEMLPGGHASMVEHPQAVSELLIRHCQAALRLAC